MPGLLLALTAGAHDIPADVTAHMHLKPDSQKVQVLVRVPLRAMRDTVFPERDGYLDTEALAPRLPQVAKLWIADAIQVYVGERLLAKPVVAATQISLPSDPSFFSFSTALRHVKAPILPSAARVTWDQVWFDVLLEYPAAGSGGSDISIRPGLERLGARVTTVLHFSHPNGTVRVYEFHGDPGVIKLDPRWFQAAWRFVQFGFWHILGGIDHLLFLLCLVLPLRRLRPLVLIVTAFTVAHSITLIASAFNVAPQALWFPPLIETLIAASIVYMALENIIAADASGRRWMVAFAFGLIHGFGFSFALRETLQLAGSHVISSLFAFNLGVELGQLLIVATAVAILNLAFGHIKTERVAVIILSALVAHTGWHWMIERGDQLLLYRW